MPSAKHLEEANAALTQWLSPEHCGHLVSAVISKYIALTPEELDEWQVQLFPLTLRYTQIQNTDETPAKHRRTEVLPCGTCPCSDTQVQLLFILWLIFSQMGCSDFLRAASMAHGSVYLVHCMLAFCIQFMTHVGSLLACTADRQAADLAVLLSLGALYKQYTSQ